VKDGGISGSAASMRSTSISNRSASGKIGVGDPIWSSATLAAAWSGLRSSRAMKSSPSPNSQATRAMQARAPDPSTAASPSALVRP
jgi:hypothetical protein